MRPITQSLRQKLMRNIASPLRLGSDLHLRLLTAGLSPTPALCECFTAATLSVTAFIRTYYKQNARKSQ